VEGTSYVSNVVHMDIKPKQIKRTYKQEHFTVTYKPSTKQWSWTVELIHKTTYSGEAPTQVKAIRAAEKHIDQVKKLQGASNG
jgi:hypothetical protein